VYTIDTILFDNKSDMDMSIQQVRMADLMPAEENPRILTPAMREILKESLQKFGWINPVIVNRITGRILTGHQRTTVASEDLGWEWCPVTYVSVRPEDELKAVVRLNEASGNWYFKNRDRMQDQHYAQMSRKSFGSAYKGWVLKDEPYNQANAAHKALVKEALGEVVVDYGCGKMTEFKLLEKLGIKPIGFDPYQKAPKVNKTDRFRPTIEHSRELTQNFLADLILLDGKPFSVVNQAVLSSIGFQDVRENVVSILGALAYIGGGPLYCSMLSTSSEPYENFLYGRVKNTTGKTKGGRDKPAAAPARQLYVPDESEPNLFVTGAGTNRQIFQKYWTPDDVGYIFEPFFTSYEVKSLRMVHVIRAYNDAPPDMEYLVHALTEQFENLRIDGEPLGMGEAAIATFDNLIEKRKAS
jgi:hypothetical protein